MTTTERFDEQALRAEIVDRWGEHGAHVDVYDRALAEIERLQEVITKQQQQFELLAIRLEKYDELCKEFSAACEANGDLRLAKYRLELQLRVALAEARHLREGAPVIVRADCGCDCDDCVNREEDAPNDDHLLPY